MTVTANKDVWDQGSALLAVGSESRDRESSRAKAGRAEAMGFIRVESQLHSLPVKPVGSRRSTMVRDRTRRRSNSRRGWVEGGREEKIDARWRGGALKRMRAGDVCICMAKRGRVWCGVVGRTGRAALDQERHGCSWTWATGRQTGVREWCQVWCALRCVDWEVSMWFWGGGCS
jgi:hypothetical protein